MTGDTVKFAVGFMKENENKKILNSFNNFV